MSKKSPFRLQTVIDRSRERTPPRVHSTSYTDRAPWTWSLSVLTLHLLLFTALLHVGQCTFPSIADDKDQLLFQKHAYPILLTQHQAQGPSGGNGNNEGATFKTIDLSKCMELVLLEKQSPTRRQLVQLHFKVKTAILPHFYKNEGPCRRIIHADSVEMFGQCYEMDIHVGNAEDFKRCKQRHPGTDRPSRMAYKQCVWNVRNVRSRATGPVPENAGFVSVGDRVVVKMYDKPTCSYPLDMGTLVVKTEKDVRKSWKDSLGGVPKRRHRIPLVPGGKLKPRLPKGRKLLRLPGLWKPRISDIARDLRGKDDRLAKPRC